MIASRDQLGNNKGGLLPIPVVVRAFAGEPVCMEAVKVGPEFVTLRRPGGSEMTVRFSYENVYSFDQSQFDHLVKAFTSGDREALERLWRKIPPIR